MSQTTLEAIHVKSSGNTSKLRLQGKEAITASSTVTDLTPKTRQIWWSNAIFFIAFHIVGLSAWYYRPSSWRTWFLCYINWQLGTLGITIGRFPFTLSNNRLSSIMESSQFHSKASSTYSSSGNGNIRFPREYKVRGPLRFLIVDGGFCGIVYTIVSRIQNLIPIPPIMGSFTVM
jgi:hypothetical protein